ncbi:MAG: Rne/Rng family ribonuclease [Actinobacteria bacterium]|nr:Rne/Rng family ribonuclease [Actinomycetota bacterium]
MKYDLLISSDLNEIRVAILENDEVAELYFDREKKDSIIGNIYLGRVQKIMSGLDSAFVDIGVKKNAFLFIKEVVSPFDYYEGTNEILKGKIKQILKPGQMLIVQVTRVPMGTKGARLTSLVSLACRYLVMMPYGDGIGVSKKLDESERERLRSLSARLKIKNMGIVIRTAAKDTKLAILKRELKYLKRLWNNIQNKARRLDSPTLIHRELELVHRILRDRLTLDFNSIVVDTKQLYDHVSNYLIKKIPQMHSKLKLHSGEKPLFEEMGVEKAIDLALKRKVWLKSGGFIVIDKTEALTAIDVNSGRFSGRNDLEETIAHINLEAVEEIVKQIKLRDIGGLIVIDFIDMEKEGNRLKIVEAMKNALQSDNATTNITDISKLGLLEMTRKNVTEGIQDVLCKPCPYCDESGYILSEESMRLKTEREIFKLTKESESEAFLIELNSGVAAMVIGQGGENVKKLENITNKYISIKGNDSIPINAFNLLKEGTIKEMEEAAIPVYRGQVLDMLVEEPHSYISKDAISRFSGYIIHIIDGRKYLHERLRVEIINVTKTYAQAKIIVR